MKTFKPLFLPALYQDSAASGRIILRDGSTATIRLSQPSDADAVAAFFQQLSPESRRQRFFSDSKPGMDMIASLCDSSNPRKQVTMLVSRVTDGAPSIIATGSYIAHDEKTAEFAVAVDDEFQGKGIGTILLERLAVIAVTNGFVRFVAITSPNNQPMLEVFRNSGFEMREQLRDGLVEVDLAVTPRQESVLRSEMRDRIFTNASIRPFFKPNAVAVVGASREPGSVGYRIMQQLLQAQFNGPIYPVNPKATVVCSIRAYKSVRDLPEPVDLAIIVVPKQFVLGVVDDCAARGVKALVVITAGFAETDDEGKKLQAALVEKVRGYGMRMVGPNCLGLINTDPQVRLGASFSPTYPKHGSIAMSSQSGALGIAILELATKLNLGLSNFVSVGNKADVTGNDLLQYWEEDPQTNVILLYLESFGNPRRFARIARRVGMTKPIVCVKSGRTSAGSRAAGSHTAALAASDVATEALFQQTGVIRAETLEEMFDLAATLANQPLPRGKRVGIVTNAGGPGILCTDACEAGGLEVPIISEKTRAELKTFLPAAAALNNPVDMIASAPPEHFRRTVELVMRDDNVDAVIVIYIPVGTADNKAIMEAVAEGVAAGRAAGAKDKPVIAVMMTEDHANVPMKVGSETLPRYLFPESAARVLSKVVRYAEWRSAPPAVIPDFDDVDVAAARAICQKAIRERNGGWLLGEEVRKILSAFKLPLPAGGVAKTADEAVKIAEQIGYPVAVKLDSIKLVHKTEVGGVLLNLKNEEAVRKAFAAIEARVRESSHPDAMNGVVVQPMIAGVAEVMVGVTEDPLFGPLIAFGLGGVYVEVLKDVNFRITPLSVQDAAQMVRSIKGFKLLQGYRGHAPADIEALEELLLRTSFMVEEIPEIRELDMNPVFALEPGKGACIVDCRI
ncbi:MAG: GNAT family N-acetyltransferase, partial [Kiritimatiellae bacterium]|nr:GNAT family N-acetyltransferase [Kiritimatiellia bacterium]MDW8459469.1 GNAT family N-acetyltransferase [Verrucomicrobiota bacterium]